MPAQSYVNLIAHARIAELEAEIERIKNRAERAKLRKDPTLRHMRAAVRQIDKACERASQVTPLRA